MRNTISKILITSLCLYAGLLDAAGTHYRFVDNEGKKHIGYSVPPEFVGNGYEVLSENGRVIETILPKKLLNARAKSEYEASVRLRELEEQREKDVALLRLFREPEEMIRVRDRKLSEFDNFIEIQRGNIHAYQNRVEKLQNQAANHERAGRAVPQDILETLATLEEKIKDAEATVVLKQYEKADTAKSFDANIKRLRELLGLADPEAVVKKETAETTAEVVSE